MLQNGVSISFWWIVIRRYYCFTSKCSCSI